MQIPMESLIIQLASRTGSATGMQMDTHCEARLGPL